MKTDDEQRAAIKRMMQAHTEWLVAAGPDACLRYLIELGTHDEAGNLTRQYGGNTEVTK
jgi:hypothetical protein